jgi:hypothetical protein
VHLASLSVGCPYSRNHPDRRRRLRLSRGHHSAYPAAYRAAYRDTCMADALGQEAFARVMTGHVTHRPG